MPASSSLSSLPLKTFLGTSAVIRTKYFKKEKKRRKKSNNVILLAVLQNTTV